MMRIGKWKQKVLVSLGVALGGFILLWCSMPLWMPWVLRPVARSQGASFARYERHGYSRFVLHQVAFSNQTSIVRAERVEALVPNVWLWRYLWGKTNDHFAEVDKWQYQARPSARTGHGASTYTNAQQVAKILQIIQHWLPSAVLSDGNIRVQKLNLDLPAVQWSLGAVSGELALPEANQQAKVRATIRDAHSYQLQIQSDSLKLVSAIVLSTNANGFGVDSKSLWRSNAVSLHVQFAHSGQLPEKATLQATNFQLPAELMQLKGYGNVSGSISGHWEGTNFGLDLDLRADPLVEQTNLPPLQATLHAHGDTNVASIEALKITAPWLVAELSRQVDVNFTGKMIREPASLKLSADLARQPWIALEGVLNGQAEVTPTEGKFPMATFRLAGSNLGDAHTKAKSLNVEGLLNWPWLKFPSVDAQFEDGSKLSARGEFELERQVITNGAFQFNGLLAQRWLPPGYAYENLSISGSAHGPIKALAHVGHVELTNFTIPQLQPLAIRADWSGTQLNVDKADLLLSTTNSALQTTASFHYEPQGQSVSNTSPAGGTPAPLTPTGAAPASLQLTLHALTLRKGGADVLQLQSPTHLSLVKPASETVDPSSPVTRHPSSFLVRLDSFDWTGSGGRIHADAQVRWPEQGNVRLALANLHSELFQDFVKSPLEPLELHSLDGNAGWTNGPAVFAVQLSAAGGAKEGVPLFAAANARGDRNGIVISNLTVTSQTSAVASAVGVLPITFEPGKGTNSLSLEMTKPLQLTLTTKPEAVFWDKLATWTGLVLGDPDCRVNLAGTWQAPHGEVRVAARQIHYQKGTRELPKMENLNIVVELERERARITQAQLFVEQQPVILTGEVPLGDRFWTGLREKKIPDWKEATGRLRIADAQLAPFAPLLPKVMAPQGKLDLDLTLSPGGALQGELTVTKGRTRPLAQLGPVREFDSKLTFSGRTLKLERLTANLGGSMVNASGEADLSGSDWLKGETPPFRFALHGTNVPLSRQPEALIRSDLDLAITKTNGAPAIISGTAQLRDSFLLRDLRDLIPGGVATPGRRPPYFSIDIEPLAEWRLATRVTGSRFLKVRSTLFNGEVSANLHMEGTLKEPVALGDVKIDSGVVRFPFASLEVRQGFVTLGSDDPHRPKMLVEAGSKKYGYDIKMEASGPVDAPVVQFTSTPPLNSEQIVLLITAGEIPKAQWSMTPQEKAQTVAVFLGRDLLQKFGLGDESEDRLTIHSGEEISEQGRATYSLEYKLTKRWSVVGEYDRFNAFNAGLKWRVYSK